MKYLLSTFTTIIAVGMFAIAPPVLAQTPDGQTPAIEAVCDPLQDDGITKGLYGLCVAFCEAQDYANEFDTITIEELVALEDSAPSGRILANYNKKKDKANNPADPEMPCILVQEPCPCFDDDDLAGIDGFLPVPPFSSPIADDFRCSHGSPYADEFDDVLESDPDEGGSTLRRAMTSARFLPNGIYNFVCRYTDHQPEPDGLPSVLRYLSSSAGTLTEAEYLECQTKIRAHTVASGLTCLQ